MPAAVLRRRPESTRWTTRRPLTVSPISLPHSWKESEFIQGTRVDLTFGVAALAEPTSVYVARTGLTFRASVNGRFVDETGDANSPTVNIASYRSTPSFRVPVEFLHVSVRTR